MILTTALLLTAGLILLVAGAELLVRGASRLAGAMGIAPLTVGLTVVAFGTSAPELAVTLESAREGAVDIAVGNVVGSNIFNVLVILGISALVTPLVVRRQIVRLDVPLMIVVSAALLFLGLDGAIGRGEGAFLFAILLLYTAFLIRHGRGERPSAPGGPGPGEEQTPPRPGAWIRTPAGSGLLMALGLAMLVLGSRWLVAGAALGARAAGVSELVIGLTVVAAGTSFPEAATSVVATMRGERDIAVGNVVGSNIFNVLSVVGLSAALSPGGIAVSRAALTFDIPFMVAVSVACLPIFFTGSGISRWEGAVFLAYYLAYLTFIGLDATHHEAQPAFGGFMLAFVIPLTVMTLAIVAAHEARERRRRAGRPPDTEATDPPP